MVQYPLHEILGGAHVHLDEWVLEDHPLRAVEKSGFYPPYDVMYFMQHATCNKYLFPDWRIE
jgi:hypothetical protein